MTQPEYEKRIEEMAAKWAAEALPCNCGMFAMQDKHHWECVGRYQAAVVALLLKQRREVLEEAATAIESSLTLAVHNAQPGAADIVRALGGSDD